MREDQSQCDQRGRLVEAAELRGQSGTTRKAARHGEAEPDGNPEQHDCDDSDARLANQKSWWVGSVLMTRGW